MGVTFRCYTCGVLQTEWRSEDGRLTAKSRYNHSGYAASVDGKYIYAPSGEKTKRFMTLQNAMKAAVVQSLALALTSAKSGD